MSSNMPSPRPASGTDMAAITRAPLFAEPEYRVEGPHKVTGQANYAADAKQPGMLWAAYVRSPHPHALIRSIDTAAARALPGVHAVLTAADLPPSARFGRRLQDYPVLCRDRVRFIGDRVASVAAETRELAEAAAALVNVEYEELPAILRPEDALADGAPILHPEADQYTFLAERGPRRQFPHANIQGYDLVTHGTDDERERAFRTAYRVFEHSFRTPRLHQGYIEPHACLVWIDDDGTVRIVSTNKSPFHLREQLASTVKLEEHHVVVHSEYIGGDFGGKGLSFDEYTCYFLARATGRPVKAVMTYVDELGAANPRHASHIRLRTAVDEQGHFLAHESTALIDGGAYAAGKVIPSLIVPAHMTLAAYHAPLARLELTCVYTNLVPCGHNRAPGDLQASFAGESHVDMIARELGIDPLELRLRNAVRDGLPNPAGHAFHEPRSVEVLEMLRREAHWDEPLPSGRGRGVAFGQRHVGTGRTTVVTRLLPDGRIQVLTGSPEQGTGTYTVIQRVAAKSLSVDPAHIVVTHVDTPDAEPDAGVGGSRAANVYGNATFESVTALKARLEDLAAEILGWPAGHVRIDADAFRDASGQSVSFLDVTRRIAQGAPVETSGSYASPQHAEISSENFCAYAVEVELDHETGAVRVCDAVFVADVGTIFNPVAHEGQLQGGFMYGLGSALTEELLIQDGRVTTLTLGEYKLPAVGDAPPLRVVLLPAQDGPGALGGKSAGELTNTTVPPAIANAVAAAGARVAELPITAERVLAELARLA
jgi:CO/xanthine dehydrogenase Mo-binding subunit